MRSEQSARVAVVQKMAEHEGVVVSCSLGRSCGRNPRSDPSHEHKSKSGWYGSRRGVSISLKERGEREG